MQLIYRAANVTEAQIVKGLLESEGVQAHVGGYYLQGGVGEMSTMDFAHVHVADEDCKRAREIIDEYEGARPASSSADMAASGNERTTFISRLLIIILIALCAGTFLYFSAK